MVEAILSAGDDPKRLCDNLLPVFQRRTLQGGTIHKPWPAVYGRAVTPGTLTDTLAKYYKRRRSAERFVARLPRWSDRVVRKRLERKCLANYTMWATFDLRDSSQDPFAALFPDADAIRIRLGLNRDEAEKKKDLLLFVYRLPRGVHPYFPTIADGYASPTWAMRFLPARDGCRCGFTWPWKEDETPAPEVVHKRITDRTLEIAVRVAKGQP